MSKKKAEQYNMNNMLGMNREEDVNVDVPEIRELTFSDKDAEKRRVYNKTLTDTVSDLYKNFIPYSYGILARVYVKELKQEDGVYIPSTTVIGIPTKNGQGMYTDIEDPYGFRTKVEIINVGKDVKLCKSGDTAYVKDILQADLQGMQNEIAIRMKASFSHPEADLLEIPTDPENEHYGYILIYENDLIGYDAKRSN